MVLESTMICVDDSDFMRNGDFVPTRMAAMQDAVNIVCHTKTRANPENNVGLLTLASSEVLTTLTTDPAKLMSKMLACQPQGELQLMSGLRVAHLALKHRQGKNHKMRIVVFIGSPVENLDSAELIRLAKRMKKEKVNVDVISFGEGGQEILQQFVDTLNGRDGTGSHLVVVPPGPTLTDAILGSPVLQSEDGVPMAAGGGFDFGIDPNDDPELALALRVSMEEQRSRQEADIRNTAETPAPGPSTEEQMLEKALAMSRDPGASGGSANPAAAAAMPVDFATMSEDEQIAYAVHMSMQENATGAETPGTAPADSAGAEKMEVDEPEAPVSDAFKNVLQDTQFVQAVLEGLPEGAQLKKETLDSAKTLVAEIKDKEKEKKKDGTKTPGSSSSSSKKPSSSEKKKSDPKKK